MVQSLLRLVATIACTPEPMKRANQDSIGDASAVIRIAQQVTGTLSGGLLSFAVHLVSVDRFSLLILLCVHVGDCCNMVFE
ncbi:hypothetical protein ACWX0P_28320 [Vibrio mediterranei]